MTLTRNRIIAGASAIVAATVTAVMLTLSTGITLPPQAQILIGPQAPLTSSWFDTVEIERVKVHAQGCVDPPPTTGDALNQFILNQYYDLTLTAYIAASRANDSDLLALARKCADSWWKSVYVDEGRNRNFPEAPAGQAQPLPPRHVGIGGLILRAMDGRPEMWDWINAYTTYHFNLWLQTRVNDPHLYYGVREGAFALQCAVWLSQTLPDSFPLQGGGTETGGAALRARYLADSEAIAVNYYGRLQQSDGSWRWDDFDEVEADGGHLVGITQPFMVGLLLNTLSDVYFATASPAVKSSITTQVTRACRHLYSDGPYLTQQVPSLNVRLRGFAYYWHGGTSTNPTKYEKGNYPPTWDTKDPSDVQNARQPIGPIIAAYGFAYQLTKDSYFKSAGDELWDSAYGSTDNIHNYADADGKSYNQNFRSAGRYLVWRELGTTAPSPTASAVVSPSPTPSASIAPSVTPTPSPTQTPTPAPKPSPSSLPSPSPIPTATPAQIRIVTWPKQPGQQNPILDNQWRDRFRLRRTTGSTAEFERVP